MNIDNHLTWLQIKILACIEKKVSVRGADLTHENLLKTGSYNVLRTMQKNGFLNSSPSKYPTGGHFYRLSKKGVKLLKTIRKEAACL